MDSPQGAAVLEPEIDAQEENFLKAAGLADRGEDIPAELIGGDKPEEKPPAVEPSLVEEKEEAVKPEPEKQERKRDAQGRFLKKDGSVDEDQAEKPAETKPELKEEKPPSDYEQRKAEKAKKDEERKARSWEALNAEKDQVRQTAAQLAQQQAKLQQFYQQQQLQNQRPQGQRYSSQDLSDASQEFMDRAVKAYKEGDVEEGDKNCKLATQAHQQANQLYETESQSQYQNQYQQFNQQQVAILDQEMAKDENLRNAETPLSKELQAIEQDQKIWPILAQSVYAYPLAIELAKLRLDAKDTPDLRKKVETYEAEIKRLSGLTETGRGGPTKPSHPKDFNQLNGDEQEQYVLDEAAKIDATSSY